MRKSYSKHFLRELPDLKLAYFLNRKLADQAPVFVGAVQVLKHLGGDHDSRQQQPLHVRGRQLQLPVVALYPLQVYEADDDVA